jgi:hypothetical protein
MRKKKSDWFNLMPLIMFAGIIAILCLMILVFAGKAKAHDPYTGWRQPKTGISCCSSVEHAGGDCAPVQARYKDGKWHAQSHWDGKWLEVPDDVILSDRDSFDGRPHMCETKNSRTILCFVPGGQI